MALQEALQPDSRFKKILLSRPLVQCDEDIGLLPGTLDEKMSAWLAPFSDVFSTVSTDKWEKLLASLEIEAVPLGMLRGRTIRNGTLILDEMQNATAAQVKCALTRLGDYSRIVVCADPDQSDRFAKPNDVPVLQAARRLEQLDTVSVVQFTNADIVRDPLVASILELL